MKSYDIVIVEEDRQDLLLRLLQRNTELTAS